jgi:hypothetical protein
MINYCITGRAEMFYQIKRWKNEPKTRNVHNAHLRQQCHNSKFVIFQEKCLKVLSAMTTQLLSSGEFCKLRYDTIPVKGASANVYFYTKNSKMSNFEL